jgi:hypothetical protein
MSKLIRVVGFLAIPIIFSLSACKDDEESVSQRDLLLANSWNVVELDLRFTQGIISVPYNVYQQMDQCRKDDLFDFLENGVLEVHDNSNTCPDSNNELVATGSWNLNASVLRISSEYFSELFDGQSALPIMFEDDHIDFEIRQLTQTTMVLFNRDNYPDPSNPQNTINVEVNIRFNAVD